MIILGIETSCDETGAAILKGSPSILKSSRLKGSGSRRVQILSNVVASSASLQAKYGGVIPEQAAREQVKSIIPVIKETLRLASLAQGGSIEPDAIAVTQGPGLIGSLLVGVETAKTLALIWNKPLIAVNHLLGHFYANWIDLGSVSGIKYYGKNNKTPSFPCIGLLVSGGHTDLVLFTAHGKYQYLGGTRDDAAGECFDKCARLLGLPYPGGPIIAKLAGEYEFKIKNLKPVPSKIEGLKINLPRPLINDKSFDFSFSGLKTAVAREVEQLKKAGQFNEPAIKQLAYEIQQAIIEVLAKKTVAAAKTFKVASIMLAGGVAANQKLGEYIDLTSRKNFEAHVRIFVPPPALCTDNAAMIATAAFFVGKKNDPQKLQADPNLSLVPSA